MLKSLEYEVRFAATGRTLSESFEFEKGVTAVTGPNEAGKSMVIEMIRYAFFGSDALRGVASDYASISVKLLWKDIEIQRTNKNAKVFRGGEIIATGTKPVNAKIIEILGFGLDVFDVACVCNQGDVERLGAMKPMERKRMIDRVIGVDRIEELQKWAGDEGLALGREVDAMQRVIGPAPIEPIQPDGYKPAADLQAAVSALRNLAAEADQLRGWLAHRMEIPTSPVRPEGDLQALEALLATVDQEQAQRVHLMSIPVVDFDADVVRGEWAAFDLWQRRAAFERAHPRCPYDRGDVKRGIAHYVAQERLQQTVASMPKGTEVTCPHCDTPFCLEHKTMADVHAKIEEGRSYLETLGAPVSDRQTLERALKSLTDWETSHVQDEWAQLKDAVEAPRPTVSREELSCATMGITKEERERRLLEIPNSGSRVTIEPKVKELQAYEVRAHMYRKEMKVYDAWLNERVEKEKRLAEIEVVIAALPLAVERLQAAQQYEAAHARYAEESERFHTLLGEITAKSADRDGWRAAREALADLRGRIKTYLVPSLNRVASHLLAQMTGGQRSSIVVDEEFNVTVDGQRLDTLSGSGKACSNLALRIGLGQVLTNNVVSLFVGDEIDASMDADRARSTQNSIAKLTASISQILIISHKEVDVSMVMRVAAGDVPVDVEIGEQALPALSR